MLYISKSPKKYAHRIIIIAQYTEIEQDDDAYDVDSIWLEAGYLDDYIFNIKDVLER